MKARMLLHSFSETSFFFIGDSWLHLVQYCKFIWNHLPRCIMKTTAPFFNDKWLKRHMQVTIHVDRLAAAIWALSSGQDGYKHRLEWLFSFRFTKMLRDMELPPFGQHMLERDPWPKIDCSLVPGNLHAALLPISCIQICKSLGAL